METNTVGRVVVAATIENLTDLTDVERGLKTPDQVRRIEVADALADTGATLLSLPKRLIEQLGLTRYKTRRARTPTGEAEFGVYNAVRLTVQGRDCNIDVAELPDECPVLLGQLALEGLDLIVDTHNHRLIGYPGHGDEQMIDMF